MKNPLKSLQNPNFSAARLRRRVPYSQYIVLFLFNSKILSVFFCNGVLDAIPQRWITRIEWFQVLARADDLSFTMNLKTSKTVEYFLLEMILKNVFENIMFRDFGVIFVLETQWKWDAYRWFFNEMLAKSMDFRQYSTNILFQNHLQQKVLDSFRCF